MFLEEYDINAIAKDVQSRCRVADWDIAFEVVNGTEMADLKDGSPYYSGLCNIQRALKEAAVYINYDACNDKDDLYWLQAIVHEYMHIRTDDFFYTALMLTSHIDSDAVKDKEEENLGLVYERANNEIAKIICNALGQGYLDKFKLEAGEDDVKDGEAKDSKRRSGKKA